jgi:hypothetical protein
MALNFPNPALQTPVNTYSPTSTPASTSNGVTYTWDGVLGAWLASVGGGTTNTFGLGLNLTGSLVKVSIPAASLPPTAGALATQAIVGSLYWDDNLTQLFIRYDNGGNPVWVAAAPQASGGGSTVTAATLAEAAAGTINTKYSSPETAVPKNAAGMTGAGLMPGGTDAQRPLTPVKGMFRFNDQGGGDAFVEYYDGSNWVTLMSGGPDNADPYGWFGHMVMPGYSI